MFLRACTRMKIKLKGKKDGKKYKRLEFITNLPLNLYGLILCLFKGLKIFPLSVCWIIAVVSKQECPYLYSLLRIKEDDASSIMKNKSHILYTVMWLPPSVIHAPLPHKIFSFSKLLNPWFSLQNPRTWTTVKWLHVFMTFP